MTNQEDLQKELLEKVKPETKPSHLKKSKSASGLVPKAPPLPTSNLENQISVLELKLETQARERQSLLSDLQSKCDELQSKDDELTEKDVALTIYLEQLVVKQKKIEELKERLETNSDLAELDISLSARHRSLKDWWRQYSKNQALDQGLRENVKEASRKQLTKIKSLVNYVQITLNQNKPKKA